MKFSVVIALKAGNAYLKETLAALARVEHLDFDIFVLPDAPLALDARVRVIPTGALGPAAKRDLALKYAQGDVIAFLDDDTFPERAWLKNAEKYFADARVAAIGGPAVTPATDNVWQKASGWVYASLLGGGNYAYRYIPRAQREVDDYPTCNLMVRRAVLQTLGGFDTTFWPGEDTKLCLDITRKLGMKIVYAPDVVVYHHRRPLFSAHLNQVRHYATHRGYFAKRFPETSLRLSYFLPTLLVVGILLGAAMALALPALRATYTASIALYVCAVLASAWLTCQDFFLTVLTALGIMATHLTYGIWFVVGLLSPRLSEERSRSDTRNEHC